MDTINYEDYEIAAKPNQLSDGTWQLNITIIEHLGSHTVSRNFSSRNSFHSREEAIPHCFEFGRQIINGGVEGYSVGNRK